MFDCQKVLKQLSTPKCSSAVTGLGSFQPQGEAMVVALLD
jgi:hypothetical protein